MFCIQRKLRARDEHPDWPNWADYLIIATIIISVLLVILPLVAFPEPGRLALPHRTRHLATKKGESPQARHNGELVERIIVASAGVIAAVIFAAIIWIRQS